MYQYQYDAVGNTLAYTQTLAELTTVTTYTYDAANQLVTAHADGDPITWHYTFDDNGSLTEITPNGTTPANGARQYTYSAAGYLLQVETHDGTAYELQAEMVYNGLGQRLSMTAHQGEVSLTTQYLLDYPANARPLAATANSQTTYYLYGNGPIAELKADWMCYLPEGTNTTRQLVDPTGAVTLSRSYTPWGELLEQSGDGDFTWGYFGGLLDAATELIYVGGGQYYDPATGRFLTRFAKPGANTVPACQPVMDEILNRTDLPLALEGIYKWIAFLPSRMDARVPVPNRYFGVFQNGDLKTRGIEARRHDTPPWLAEIQMDILNQLAKQEDVMQIPRAFPAILSRLHQHLRQLSAGRVPPEKLLVSQTLSRELDEYKTPAARAARHLQEHGKPTRPGQRVRFLYTRTAPGVYAWDAPGAPDPRALDVARYRELFHRAAHTVLSPFGVDEERLQHWLFSKASYHAPVGILPPRPHALPLDL